MAFVFDIAILGAQLFLEPVMLKMLFLILIGVVIAAYVPSIPASIRGVTG